MAPPTDYSKMPLESLREEVQRRALVQHLKTLEALDYSQNWVDPREPLYDDASFWSPMSGAIPGNLNNQARGEYLPIYLNALGLKEVRDRARWLCAYNEYAINVLQILQNYIVGTGLKYVVSRRFDDPDTPEDDTGKTDFLTQRVQDVLDQFCDDNDWGELESECVRRLARDGEVFLRFFVKRRGLTVRVIEPEFVVETGGEPHNSFGVITEPNDVQSVKGYMVSERPGFNTAPTFVPAYEILHLKNRRCDRTHKRGLPMFFPVQKNLERVEKLLRNMSVLAQVQATYAVIRKHSNVSAGAIRSFADNLTDLQYQNNITGRTDTVSQLKPGSILDTSANTEYEFPSAGLNAAAYVEIVMADLAAVAASFGFPVWMLTAKTDGVNFASALVGEAPHSKGMECEQNHVARKFGRGRFRRTTNQPVMWRVIVMACRLGMLPREALRECEIQVECPRLTTRDRASETNRLATLSQASLLSKRTWAALEDLDYDQEKRNLEDEPPPEQPGGPPGEGGPPAGAPQPGDPAATDEDGDGDPTNEELDALLAQLKQDDTGGALSSPETVAGADRPESGLARGQRPGTLTEGAHLWNSTDPATLAGDGDAAPAFAPDDAAAVQPDLIAVTAEPPAPPLESLPHRKVQVIVRDANENIARIETTVEPLASPEATEEGTP